MRFGRYIVGLPSKTEVPLPSHDPYSSHSFRDSVWDRSDASSKTSHKESDAKASIEERDVSKDCCRMVYPHPVSFDSSFP